jgi:hypothetical protein
MSEPRIVNRGVDTLVVNIYYTDRNRPIRRDIDTALALQLDEWKKTAQELGEPFITPWVFNEASLQMQPNGAGHGQWPWMLKTPDITLYVSQGKWNGVGAVRLSSQYLWSCTSLRNALILLQAFLTEVFGQEMHLQPSEVHLCADIAGWLDVATLDRRVNFVSRSRKRTTHFVSDWDIDLHVKEHSFGLKETGFDFSKRGALSSTIYDKTREMKQSGKEWFVDIWRLHGWDEAGDGAVWRVEFKFKREALHEFQQQDKFWGIEDAFELPERLPVLWAYAAGHVDGEGDDALPDGWLRCVVPTNDKNRARWPTHPAWKAVQGAFRDTVEMPEEMSKLVRKRREEHNIERGLEAILGYATSLSSWIGDDLADPDADLTVFLHWLAVNGQTYLERKEREFGAEVQRKRVKFGLQASLKMEG